MAGYVWTAHANADHVKLLAQTAHVRLGSVELVLHVHALPSLPNLFQNLCRQLLQQIAQRVKYFGALPTAYFSAGFFKLLGRNLVLGLAVRAARIHAGLIRPSQDEHERFVPRV